MNVVVSKGGIIRVAVAPPVKRAWGKTRHRELHMIVVVEGIMPTPRRCGWFGAMNEKVDGGCDNGIEREAK